MSKAALSETKRYQAYPEYKDSGVEWLENIPSHWETKPLKHLCSFNDDVLAENTKKDYELCYVDIGSVSATDGISRVDTMTYGSAPSRARRLVRDGDVIVSTVRTYLEAIAPINNPPSNMVVSTGFAVIRPNNKLYKGYAAYCLRANGFIKEVVARSVGVSYPAINASELVGIAVPSLPIQEQTQIANFLDHETAKIDTLIEKQQQLIKLLKEKRQAVISHAVTKGLNPQAPMKDSGVGWLGEVPEHWDIKKAKYLFDFITSGSRGWAEYYADSGSLFFRIANLTRDTVEPKLSSIQCVQPPKGAEGERSKIRLNDLLISITADLGSVCVANQSIANGYVSQHVALCRPNNQMVKSSRWLAYSVLSDTAKEQLLGSGYGGTKVQLSLEDIRELVIAFPPQEEQLQIEVYIDTKLSQFENLMQKAYMQVELLQERRTALISAAVTGKIDVREWRAH
ncbi:putative Type I site-specific deoxyribonuclease [Vibrio harveyi]|uniref:restriction endonuclease subunit S n=1 Tax=Vibrio harveyi group TaxID=717610 RepID=UPI0003FA149A|nr:MULTISPECIES: restriction endonuclease subunit S [Vibrio harveyi group]MCG9235115.1 restriction endonuclease subunit S [Vibrio harveyi]MCG9586990.1 restriction endonuclease subunit S [Vibrio harveyi]MCG9613279.1 restriction endonuclease subunit S [Vibrio harveyi]MCG9667965.1 restriction endonuclease subunit S [Vibrio harveyi]CAH1195996.1 putative Type I site-specific deoxyribonuclease [Vibrio harveyi]